MLLGVGLADPFLVFVKNCLFIDLFLFSVALGLLCCPWAISSCSRWELLSLWGSGFSWGLLLWAQVLGTRAQWLSHVGSRARASVVVVHRLRCPMACGIFPDQGSNLWPLHWWVDSYPLDHQGSPWLPLSLRQMRVPQQDLMGTVLLLGVKLRRMIISVCMFWVFKLWLLLFNLFSLY